MKLEKKYIRKIEGMGEGLVLFKISIVDRRIRPNHHLYFEDKRKPPLDIAINPDDGTIEYISYFAQDEIIPNIEVKREVVNVDEESSMSDNNWNEDKFYTTLDGINIESKFQFSIFKNDIWIIRENTEETVLNEYKLSDFDSILFSCNKFCGVILKNLSKEEIREIYKSRCL